jgi:hypothetical protein
MNKLAYYQGYMEKEAFDWNRIPSFLARGKQKQYTRVMEKLLRKANRVQAAKHYSKRVGNPVDKLNRIQEIVYGKMNKIKPMEAKLTFGNWKPATPRQLP